MGEILTKEGLLERFSKTDQMIANVLEELKSLKTKSGANADEDVRMQKAIEAVFEKNTPKVARYSVPVLDASGNPVKTDKGIVRTEYGKQFDGFGDFIMATVRGDGRVKKSWEFSTKQRGDAHAGQNEDTSAQGGYTVPVEYSTEIINLINDYAIARQICTVNTMSSKTRRLPRQLTNPDCYFVAEKTDKTMDKATFEAVTQTAKKLAVIITITDELMADNICNLDTWLMGIVAEQIALHEDNEAFMGDGTNFTGVRYATGVNNDPMDAASLAYTDIVKMIASVPTSIAFTRNMQKITGCVFVTNQAGFAIIFSLKDGQNRPLYDFVTNSLMGYPLYVTNQITQVAGKEPLLFGDFKKAVWISDAALGKNKQYGLNVLVSQEASKPDSSESAFVQDETWLRFVKRFSIDVVQPDAVSYMDIA